MYKKAAVPALYTDCLNFIKSSHMMQKSLCYWPEVNRRESRQSFCFASLSESVQKHEVWRIQPLVMSQRALILNQPPSHWVCPVSSQDVSLSTFQTRVRNNKLSGDKQKSAPCDVTEVGDTFLHSVTTLILHLVPLSLNKEPLKLIGFPFKPQILFLDSRVNQKKHLATKTYA